MQTPSQADRAATESIEVRTDRIATGGEAVARLEDGRVVFVRGALEAETVAIELTAEKKRFARGRVTRVIDPSNDRITPPCTHAGNGDCGGCDWMHIAANTQVAYKVNIVREQLTRLGKVTSPQVRAPAMPRGLRTTARCIVTNGRAGFRGHHSDAGFAATMCKSVHPVLEELIVDGRFGDATEVTLRLGAATGECMVLTNGSTQSVQVPPSVSIVSARDVGSAAIHERVAGRSWRISAESFFQTSLEGAEALVGSVERSLAGSTGPLVDLYAGVGLLGGGAAPDRVTCAVESGKSSVADARHNLGEAVHVVQSQVERWTATQFETVIADPARRGLGAAAVAVIDATGASRLVLVSCDPASLGRDTQLLAEHGWSYGGGEVIDMFPDTSRIEVVSSFSR